MSEHYILVAMATNSCDLKPFLEINLEISKVYLAVLH